MLNMVLDEVTVQIKIVVVVVFNPIFAENDLIYRKADVVCLGCKPQILQVQK